MLYEHWQAVWRQRPDEMALCDFASGRRWTFSELDQAVARLPSSQEAICFPHGLSADFVVSVLHAWKIGQVVCPLETSQAIPQLPPSPAGIVHLKTTSATSGTARMVAMTAAQLKADADNIVQTMGLQPGWPNLGAISLAHSYGFSNLVTPLLLHGIPLMVLPSPLPEIVRSAAASLPHVTLPAVPAMWRAWNDAGSIPANVRLAISAGAPLPIALEQEVLSRSGLKLHNFYGSSECGGIAYDRSSEARTDAAFVGHAMANVLLSTNPDGCLEVRGAAVGETYWPNAETGLGEGCFRTNDLAQLSKEGVFLRGRLNDQINVAGRKISPEAIERVLAVHEQVKDCLVFGVPSQDAGRVEEIVACVATRNRVTNEVLKQFLLSRLPAWQVPRDWWFVETLGVNQRGKLSRNEWRKKYLARNGEKA
jgi:long-chain acyl-CoA synthetase